MDTEYLTSNRRIRFPFEDNSVVPGLSETDSILVFGCFVDASVQLKDAISAIPYITGISLVGHTLKFTLAADGLPSINLSCSRTDSRFSVLKSDDASSWCWYSFVLSNDGIQELEEAYESFPSIAEVKLRLNIRCIDIKPVEVSSISIYSGIRCDPVTGERYSLREAIAAEADGTVTGDVLFTPGNNMRYGDDSQGWNIIQTQAEYQ